MFAATLERLLTLVESRLGAELTNAASLERTRELATSLPASITGFFGFERSLAAPDSGTDFAFSLSRYGIDWLAASGRWPQVSTFVRIWRTHFPAGALDMWLEFDTSRNDSNATPNIFLALDRQGVPSNARRALVSAAMENGCAMGEARLQSSALLEACVDACPDGVTRLHLGFMLARASPAVRLCALALTYDESLSFLNAVGWSGSLNGVARVIAPYAPLCDGFGVHVDLLDEIGPAVGIELLYDGNARENQPNRELRWIPLLEQLVDDEVCLPGERDALLSWVSQTVFNAPLVDRLIAGPSQSGERLLHGTLCTGLSHVKLSFDGDGVPSAKAYFGVTLENGPAI